MSAPRPLPEFWYPLARMLLVLKALLAATAPDAFGAISARVHGELRYAGAFLRRYLLALAQGLDLAPLRARPQAPASTAPPEPRATRCRAAPFPLAELPADPRPPRGPQAAASPHADWAIALHRTEILLAALRAPLPIARRLARRLARGAPPVLREAAVPWHVLRALPPALDCLLTRLDCLARPDIWSGIDPDTG